MALIQNKHAKIMLSWLFIGIGGFSSFLVVKRISTANRKKEVEIRKQIKKRVQNEIDMGLVDGR